MFVRSMLVFVIAATPLLAQQQEEGKPKVPKDSILATITGCVKGRVIRADDVRQVDTTTGVSITARTFRIAGKKDVMNVVKDNDGHEAEIIGIIKKSSLLEPGVKFKGGRVVIGGGTSASPTGGMPSPAENVVVIDAISVTPIGGTCGGL